MDKCGKACPYNTLDGCKVKEYRAICPLTNMATPITEYKMTNADRIRAMSDEELGKYLCWLAGCHDCEGRSLCEHPDFKSGDGYTKWLKQPAE